MPSLNHIHSYQRLRGQKGKTAASLTNRYKCSDPACTHFATREEIHGKNCRCSCGNVFQLSWDDLRRARPMCQNCSNTAEARKHRAAKILVEQALSRMGMLTGEESSLRDLRNELGLREPGSGDIRSQE